MFSAQLISFSKPKSTIVALVALVALALLDLLSIDNMENKDTSRKVVSDTGSQISVTNVGREALADALPPHESYEGAHRYDPAATWTEAEERKVIRKTDLYLLVWICVMVRILLF